MSGALALIAGLFVTSCHDDDVYGNIDVIEKKTQDFQKAFKSAFGPINPNQTWGFKQTSAETKTVFSTSITTRTAQPNSNQWGTDDDNGKYKDYPKPADITPDELAAVLEVFNQKGAESYTALFDLDRFFVQQVYCGPNGSKMTELACYSPQGNLVQEWWPEYKEYYTHEDIVNNFNGGAYNGNINQGCMLMFDSSTSDWSYKSTQGGGQRFHYFRMEYIPGYGYYVGLDFASEKQGSDANDNEYFERDYVYNDWIIKIVPGLGVELGGGPTYTTKEETDTYVETLYAIVDSTMETGRILCEDLGNFSNREDLDYNDVVFNADIIKRTYKTTTITIDSIFERTYEDGTGKLYEEKFIGRNETVTIENKGQKNYATIELYAAGGTLNLTVAGQEVHELFGVGVTTMVNTRDKNTPTVNGANTVVRNPIRMVNPEYKKEREDHTPTVEDNFKDLRSDKQKEDDQYLFYGYGSIIEIPVIVLYENVSVLELKSDPGQAPHKILVDKDTRWASERCAIDKAYPLFEAYVNGEVKKFWKDDNDNDCGNDDYLYEKGEIFSTEAEGDVKETVVGGDGVMLNVLWKSEDGYDISRGLYFTNKNLLENQGIKEGDRLRFEGSIIEGDKEWAIFLSDGNSSRLHSDLTSLNSNNYAEVTLTKDMVDKLLTNKTNAAMVISGYNVLLTRVSLIKK